MVGRLCHFSHAKLYLLLANPQDILSLVHNESVGIHNVRAKNHFIDNVSNEHLVAKFEKTQAYTYVCLS